MDFTTEREGTQCMKVLGIFGPAPIEVTLAGIMLKILRSDKLKARCGLGEGTFIKPKEVNKQSITRNEILKSHDEYVAKQGRVDLRGT